MERNSAQKDAVETVAERILALMNEAADAVFWNVATANDIDATRKGVNYPKGSRMG